MTGYSSAAGDRFSSNDPQFRKGAETAAFTARQGKGKDAAAARQVAIGGVARRALDTYSRQLKLPTIPLGQLKPLRQAAGQQEMDRAALVEERSLLRVGADGPFHPYIQRISQLQGWNEEVLTKVVGTVLTDITLSKGSPFAGVPEKAVNDLFTAFFRTHLESTPDLQPTPLGKGIEELIEQLRSIEEIDQTIVAPRTETIRNSRDQERKATLTHEMAAELGKRILALPIGQTMTWRGGWSSSRGPGHALLYQITAQPEGNFDLHVLNLGGGAECHTHTTSSFKQLADPIRSYRDIPVRTLFPPNADGQPTFDLLQLLLEPVILGASSEEVTYDGTVIYSVLDRMLPADRHLRSKPYLPITSYQRGGSCPATCRKILAYATLWKENHSNTPTDRLLLQLELCLLTHAFRQLEPTLNQASREKGAQRLLLKQAASRLLEQCAARGEELLGEEFIATALATAYDIERRVTEIDQAVATQLANTPVELAIAARELAPRAAEQFTRTLATIPVDPAIRGRDFGTHRSVSPKVKSYTADEAMSKAGELARAKSAASNALWRTDVENFITNLFLSSDLTELSSWSAQRLERLAEHLDQIGESYSSAVLSSRQPLPTETNCAFALYALQHTVALAHHAHRPKKGDGLPEADLSQYGLYSELSALADDPHQIFLDPMQQDLRAALLTFFRERSEQALFNINSCSYLNARSIRDGKVPDFAFYNALIQENPDLGKAADSRDGVKKDDYPILPLATVKVAGCVRILDNAAPLKSAGYGPLHYLKCAGFRSSFFAGRLGDATFEGRAFPYALEVTSSEHKTKNQDYIHFVWTLGDRKVLYPDPRFSSDSLQPPKFTLPGSDLFPRDSEGKPHFTIDPEEALHNRRVSGTKQTDEGTVLLKRALGKNEQAHLRGAISPSLQPYQEIAFYSEKLELLEDPEERNRFEALFFKAHLDRRRLMLPPVIRQELIEGNLARALSDFFEKGIERFCLIQPGKKPQIEPALFFVRLLQQCRIRAPHAELPSEQELLISWANRDDLTEQERSKVHLYLANSFVGRDPKALSPEEQAALFYHWTLAQQNPTSRAEQHTLFFQHVSSYVLSIIGGGLPPSVNSKDLTLFLRELIAVLAPSEELENDGEAVVRNWPLIVLPDGENQWTLNLCTGHLYKNSGAVGGGISPSWESSQTFTNLFGTQSFNYRRVGEFIEFEDSQKRSYRVVLGIGDNFDEAALRRGLQRKVNGQWQQHVRSLTAAEDLDLPLALVAGHSHWVPVSSPNRLLIEELAAPNRRYLMIEGVIHPIGKDGEILGRRVGKIDRRNLLGQPNRLTPFEDPRFITVESDATGITAVNLPRYSFRNGHLLQFIQKGSDLVWSENSHYRLAPQQRAQLLRYIPNSLLLEEKKSGKLKVLLPCVDLTETSADTPGASIDVMDAIRRHSLASRNIEDELKAPQIGHRPYYEYDLVDGELRAGSMEGTIFLALLLLQSRDYEKAAQLLRGIESTAKLNERSIEMLHRITRHPENNRDRTADASAIVLLAAGRLISAGETPLPRRKNQDGTFATKDQLKECIDHYLERLNIATARVRLTFAEQWIIHRKVESAVLRNLGKGKLPEPSSLTYGRWTRSMEMPSLKTRYHTLVPPDEERRENWASELLGEFLPPIPSNFDLPPMLFTQGFAQELRANFWGLYHLAQRGGAEGKGRVALILNAMTAMSGAELQQVPRELVAFLTYAVNNRDLPKIPKKDATASEKFDFCQRLSAGYAKMYGVSNSSSKGAFQPKLDSKEVRWDGTGKTNPPVFFDPRADVPPKYKGLVFTPSAGSPVEGGDLESFFQTAERATDWIDPASFSFTSPEVLEAIIGPNDQNYTKAITHALEEFERDFQAGAEALIQEQRYLLASPIGDTTELRAAVETKKEELNLRREVELQALLDQANVEPSERLTHLAGLMSKGKREIDLGDLISFFLKRDPSVLTRIQPELLNHKELYQPLYQAVGEYLMLAIEQQKMERALEQIDDLNELPAEESDKRAELQNKIANTLKAEQPDLIGLHPEILVFEYAQGIMLYKRQAEILQNFLQKDAHGHFKSGIIQEMMAGGKTAVIAAILAYLSPNLSLLVVPPALLPQVRDNLRKVLRETFNQTLHELAVRGEELTLERVTQIKDLLTQSQEDGSLVLTSKESLNAIEIEFIAAVKRRVEANGAVSAEENQRIALLKETLTILRLFGEAVVDEVDKVLNEREDVRRPEGSRTPMAADRTDLILEVVRLLSSETPVRDGGPSIGELVGYHRNGQTLLTNEDYEQLIRPTITRALATRYKPLALMDHPELHNAFVRYVAGEIVIDEEAPVAEDGSQKYKVKPMNPALQGLISVVVDDPRPDAEVIASQALSPQEKEDLSLLVYLRRLATSDDEALNRIADLAALSKHFLQELLPSTFSRSGGQNFGRLGIEVRPFLAADSPAPTEFGNHLEHLTFHLVTALQFGINRDEVKHLVEVLTESAKEGVARSIHSSKPEQFDQTAEAIWYKELTGVDLFEAMREEALDLATEALRKRRHSLLEGEAEVAQSLIYLIGERITATSHTTVEQVASFRGMSATIDNHEGYHPNLIGEGQVHESIGTEGKIAYSLMNKLGKREVPHHTIESLKVADFFPALYQNHSERHRLRGMQDPAGLVRGQSGEEVAAAFMEVFESDPESEIEAVLFFTRKEDETTPDSFAILRRGEKEPIFIEGGTSPSVIESYGVDPNKCFVFWGERQNTGTNIQQADGIINLCTTSHQLMRSDMHQALLRARGWWRGQTVEFVSYAPEQAAMVNGGRNPFDILLTTVRNQAKRRADNTLLSYRKLLHAVYRNAGATAMVLGEDPDEALRNFSEFLVETSVDRPYAQFGGLDRYIPTIDSLVAEAERFKALFANLPHSTRSEIEALGVKIDAIIKKAKASYNLPEEVKENLGAEDIGTQQELLVQQTQKTTVQLLRDLQNELDRYNSTSCGAARPESEFGDRQCELLLGRMKSRGEGSISSKNLKAYLQNQSETYGYPRPYHHLVDDDLMATKNLLRTFENGQPLLHRGQKPFEHLLVVKGEENSLSFLAVSIYESEELMKFIRQNQTSDVWLIQSNGTLLAGGGDLPEEATGKIDRTLMQMQFLNGEVGHLNKRESMVGEWLVEPTDSAIVTAGLEAKLAYLQMKVEGDPEERKRLYCSRFFLDNIQYTIPMGDQRPVQLARHRKMQANQRSATLIRTITDPSLIQKFDPREVGLCSPDQVPYLLPTQVQDLRTEAQLAALPEALLPSLTVRQIGLLPDVSLPMLVSQEHIHAVPLQKLRFLTDDQFAQLSNRQIRSLDTEGLVFRLAPTQLSELSEEQLALVIRQEQVAALSVAQLCHVGPQGLLHISDDQIAAITEAHLDLILKLGRNATQKLRDELLHLLSPDQVDLWRDPVAIERLPDAQLDYLSNEVIEHLIDPTIARLPAGVIGRLRHESSIQRLAPQQLKWLEASQLSWLTKRQWQHFKTPELVAKVPPALVDYLPVEALGYLNAARISALRSRKLIRALAESFPKSVRYIHPTQIKHLTDATIFDLHPDLVRQLDRSYKEIVVKLSPARLDYLPTGCWDLVTDEQVNALDDRQLANVIPPQYLNRLPVESVHRIPVGHLRHIVDPHLIRAMNRDQLAGIEPLHYQWLTEQQIQEAHPRVLQQFNSTELIHRLPPSRIGEFSEHQKANLSTKQIRNVPYQEVWRIPHYHISRITGEQARHLTGNQVKQLRTGDAYLIRQLYFSQLPFLRNEEAPHVAESHRSTILKDWQHHAGLLRLLSPAEADSLPAAAARHFTKEQVGGLTAMHFAPYIAIEHVDEMSDRLLSRAHFAQLEALSPERIGRIRHAAVIERLPPAQLAHIRDDLWQHVTEEQIRNLPVPLFGSVPANKLHALPDELIPQLPYNRVSDIPPEDIANGRFNVERLSPRQVDHLGERHITRLTSDHPLAIRRLSPLQFHYLRGTALHLLTQFEVGNLRSRIQLNALADRQIAWVNPPFCDQLDNQRLRHLSQQQLQRAAAPYMVPHLATEQVRWLPDHLMNDLTRDQIRELPADQLHRLPRRQMRHVAPNQVPLLQERQWAQLVTQEQMGALPVSTALRLRIDKFGSCTTAQKVVLVAKFIFDIAIYPLMAALAIFLAWTLFQNNKEVIMEWADPVVERVSHWMRNGISWLPSAASAA